MNGILAQSKASVVVGDGVELAVNQHVLMPYSDKEWEEGLRQQLTAAPLIARRIIEACPGVVAVTTYGPLTRKDKKYAMFHPRRGVQLGAFFERGADITKAVSAAEEQAKTLGVKVITGTGHDGAFGIGSFSGWHFCNEEYVQELEKKFNGEKGDTWLIPDVDKMLEIIVQVLRTRPLAVGNEEEFKRALVSLQTLSDRFLRPIFSKVRQLQEHMNNGYPYPLEYTAPSSVS